MKEKNIELFKKYLKERDLSDRTIKNYLSDNKFELNKKYIALKKWSSKGILNSDKTKLPQLDLKARLVIPDNYGNYGFLVYSNFDSLLNWNRSNYFAIAVGKLSDSISEK